MTNIVSWEYYSSLYSKVTEEEFPELEVKAEHKVREIVGVVKWIYITEETFGFEVLKDTICQVMDIMKTNEESGAGKGVSSVSNDGYSESYSLTNSEEINAALEGDIRRMLSGTGLIGAY